MYNDTYNLYVCTRLGDYCCPYSMDKSFYEFGIFYGTFYVEVGNCFGPKLKETIPLLDIFVEEKKIIFCLENGNLLMPALWVVNIHRNQHG